MLQVDCLLSCGKIIILPVESVLRLPTIGDVVRCSDCKREMSINQVGQPYRREVEQVEIGENQRSILGDT